MNEFIIKDYFEIEKQKNGINHWVKDNKATEVKTIQGYSLSV